MRNVDRPGGDYTYIVDDTATVIKVGAGVLKKIVINKALTGTIKLIDSEEATETTANIATVTNPTVGLELNYGLDFTEGLIVIASGACDITVVTI